MAKQPNKTMSRRTKRMSINKALAVLKRAGVGKPPMKGDELREPRRRRR